MTLLYCRMCDLGFCERHAKDHPKLEGHSLAPTPEITFCAVCTGIYVPYRRGTDG